MFNFDQIKQTIVAAFAAVILTTTAVGAAVGPARVLETTPVADLRA